LVRKGLLYRDLKGVGPCLPGVFLSLMRAIGKSLVQGEWVSWANLAKCLFKSSFVFFLPFQMTGDARHSGGGILCLGL
jgi:hypothetical protein